MIKELITDQTVLAMLPIVSLGVIAAIVGYYWIWKERREDRERQPHYKN